MENPEQNRGDKKHRCEDGAYGERHGFVPPFPMAHLIVQAHAMMKEDHPRRKRWKMMVRKISPHDGTSADGSP
ncbi:hypothetical protein [Shinella sp.]|uniref:hypothetical protein n=1 Tax=Shinella sp. TaxID=1870904 RepID=UPI0028A92325|nr:hypothetical protein [Shinella sp.]